MINTNFIIKSRATGKTTGLIYASEVTGYPIVVDTMTKVEHIKDKAKEMGCNIPHPICARDLVNSKIKIGCPILIDEGQFIIEMALEAYLGTSVAAVAFTPNT